MSENKINKIEQSLNKTLSDIALSNQKVSTTLSAITKTLEKLESRLSNGYYPKPDVDNIILKLESKLLKEISTVNTKVVHTESIVEKNEVVNAQVRKTVTGLVGIILATVIGAVVKLVIN